LIISQGTLSTEVRYAAAADPALAFRVFLPREPDHEYDVDHLDGRWIIRSNRGAPNFRLMEAQVGEEGDPSGWRELVGHRDDAFINDFEVFRSFVAISERSGGLNKVRIRGWDGAPDFHVAADEPAYTMDLGRNAEIDTTVLRYVYASLTTPATTYDYDLASGQRTLLKREPVLGGFDPAMYESEYRWATARDGTQVPVSIVHRRGVAARRHGAAAAVRLRCLRLLDRPRLLALAAVAARPRLRLCHRPRPRRPGDGPALV
jgi:oligopeptidase B